MGTKYVRGELGFSMPFMQQMAVFEVSMAAKNGNDCNLAPRCD
jgi:hypothetical protein